MLVGKTAKRFKNNNRVIKEMTERTERQISATHMETTELISSMHNDVLRILDKGFGKVLGELKK